MDWNLWKCSFKYNRYYYDINKTKNFEIEKSQISSDLDQQQKIQL